MPGLRRSRTLLIPVLLVLCLGAVRAAGSEVATLRVESLDALLAAANRLGVGSDVPDSPQFLLDSLPFKAGDGSWLDRTRPLVGVLPPNGVMAASRAWVLALPVRDPQSLAATLAREYPDQVVEDSLHTLAGKNGSDVFLRFLGDHVVLGQMRVYVENFDLAAALDPRDLPPGPITIEVRIEPLAPLIQMGLASARAMAAQNGAAQGGDPDATAVADFMDLYFDVLTDVMNNISRLQISADVQGGNLTLVKRLVARPGTTLEGMLAAQSGALPPIASYLDPRDAAYVVAGQLELTPAFRLALADYARRYGAVMESLGETVEASAAMPGFGGFMGRLGGAAAGFIDCYRGDMAQVMRFGDAGMEGAGVAGVVDADRCRAAVEEMAETMVGMPALAENGMTVEFEREALVYAGVRASRQSVHPAPGAEEDAREALGRIWGEGGMTTYSGFLGPLMLTATGGGEPAFRALVDRASAAAKGPGIGADYFAPLKPGPGFYVRADLGRLAAWISTLAPESESGELPFGAGAVVAGARFTPDAATVEIIVPTSLWTGQRDNAAAVTP